ncbi:serine hydrolase domain-containing protein [Lederbergia citri]|uniref:Beta-lactamase family protein n=1 Tax=Lederbergia citri TaxID=2833580 RepID=A0A942YJU0_9BACI|nr:serine hydrolase domain-containing protein [Lederbergia citri]MBS4196701.1 beta-lactamase family protein [Lederbergia citri]
MSMRIIAIILCSLFIFHLFSSARSNGSMQEEQFETSVFSEVDAYIAREMKRQRLPGLALGIVKGDRILYLKGYGEADSSGRPVTPETPFGLGSIGKSITATAVLQLAEKGKIDLDAPIQRYFPTKYRGAEFITVRQLLNQTSGFSQISTFDNTLTSINDQYQDAIEKNALSYAEKFLTRTQQTEHTYRYSNANYVLLGYIVQQVSGQSYGDYVKEHIFSPLSMHNSFVTLDEASEHGLATPHRRIFGYNVAYDGPYVYIPGDAPAGYHYTNVKDMSHYLIAQMNGGRFEDNSVLSSESIRLMQTEPVPGTYGMGWSTDSINGLRVIGSPGGSLGFQAQTFMVLEQQLGVIVFANVLDAIDAEWPDTHIITTTHIASGVINLLNEKPIGGSGLSISQKYWLVNGLIFTLSAWLIYTTVRTAKRCLGPLSPDNSGHTEISIKVISRIVLYFAGLFIILLLNMTQIVPLWHIATIFQPDVYVWLMMMAVLMALKGTMEIILLVRSIRHEKTSKLSG